MKKVLLFIILVFPAMLMAETTDLSTKKERNYIRRGNECYNNNHYRDAEILYKKALEINPISEIAQFNLASSLMKQSSSAQADSPHNPLVQADSIFKSLTHNAVDKKVVEQSYYNLGNISFDKQDYSQSIEMYKSALRINPDNNDARENLRLAQLKKQEQEQNKDNNQKNDQQQDKNQKNDSNKNNQEQNKQENKDKQEQDKEQDKNNGQDQSQQQNQQQKHEKQQSQGISDANAEKILKTMENEENATRRKVNELKRKEDAKNASRRKITNQW